MKWYAYVLACMIIMLGVASLTGGHPWLGSFFIIAGLVIISQVRSRSR